MKPIIAVIFGGVSVEHKISLLSAMNVIEHINHEVYDILQIGIAQDGKMYVGPEVLLSLQHNKPLEHLPQCIISTNQCLPGIHIFSKGKDTFQQKVDLFFPVVHGTQGEDGSLQGILEYTGIPYIGSHVLGSALGMDKIIMKKVFATYRLPQVPFLPFTKKQINTDIISVKEEILANLRYPLFIKPANLGSSIGVKKVKTNGKLEDALEEACHFSERVIVEQGLTNIREIECAVLETEGELATSMVGEVIPSGEFYDYDAKYNDENTQMIIPALLDKVTTSNIQKMAKDVFTMLDLRGVARVDFFVNDEQIFINEVNTLPGLTAASMYPRLFAAQGMNIETLLQKMIDNVLTS
ncbi:MAG: D-alanine--D-alanine ligase [Candidatus Abawacabacteria bacterium]|nr:D-alanine--D-alanine ligase [Candidatus Abawacabacteria bacterium]